MDAYGAIAGQSAFAEYFRELARRDAPHHIHLKKSILPVQPAERARHIGARFAANRRHAEGIALDRRGSAQAGYGRVTLQLRQARSHAPISPGHPEDGYNEQDADRAREEP